jgi:hypothetical protein
MMHSGSAYLRQELTVNMLEIMEWIIIVEYYSILLIAQMVIQGWRALAVVSSSQSLASLDNARACFLEILI